MTGKAQSGSYWPAVLKSGFWLFLAALVALMVQHERESLFAKVNLLVERQNANILRIEESAVARAVLRESFVRLDERLNRLEGK